MFLKGCINERVVKQYVSFEKNYLAFDIVFIRFKAFQKCFLRHRQTRFHVISKSFISLSKGWLPIHDILKEGGVVIGGGMTELRTGFQYRL